MGISSLFFGLEVLRLVDKIPAHTFRSVSENPGTMMLAKYCTHSCRVSAERVSYGDEKKNLIVSSISLELPVSELSHDNFVMEDLIYFGSQNFEKKLFMCVH